MKMEIESIPTQNYSVVIQVNVPVRFYFNNSEFDGVEFGEFKESLQPWQRDMVERCLRAVGNAIGQEVEP